MQAGEQFSAFGGLKGIEARRLICKSVSWMLLLLIWVYVLTCFWEPSCEFCLMFSFQKPNISKQVLWSLSTRFVSIKAMTIFMLQVVLFDVQQRTTLGELNMPFLKYAVWNADGSQVALLSKHAIIIADKKLQNSVTGNFLILNNFEKKHLHPSIHTKLMKNECSAWALV